jgi:hypothetical protein
MNTLATSMLPKGMKKIVIALSFLVLCFGVKAQFNINELGKKSLYFGIAMGINMANYNIVPAALTPKNDSVKTIRSSYGPGFNLGIISNYQFHKYFDLRFIPTLSFSDKNINYQLANSQAATKTISSIYLDFPLLVRFKSQPLKDIRIYVIGGARYDYDLASNVKARRADDIVKVKQNDVAVEYGIGVMIYFPYFILSPELKKSHGVINILSQTPGLLYSRTIQRIYSHTITLTLNLEG